MKQITIKEYNELPAGSYCLTISKINLSHKWLDKITQEKIEATYLFESSCPYKLGEIETIDKFNPSNNSQVYKYYLLTPKEAEKYKNKLLVMMI